MNTEGSVLNHTGDIDGHREHKKHASYLLPDGVRSVSVYSNNHVVVV